MKLSVIVPVYNLERYIAATLDSLLAIEFSDDYEIIVVNDGSTDGSREIIEEYQKKGENIRLINIENGGVSNARNVGLEYAAGEYLTFVDGDDTVQPDFFQKAVHELDAGRCDFVQTNLRIVAGNRIEYIQFNPEDRIVSDREEMLGRFFGPAKTVSNSVCGKVFRAELIRGLAFDPSLRIAEDQKFVFDALLSAERIMLLQMAGYDYFQRSASAMHALDRNRASDILRVLEYCRGKVGPGRVRSLIDADRLDVLFFIYHDSLESNEDCETALRDILALERHLQRDAMSRKTRLKLAILKHARPLYDLIYKGSRCLSKRL